MKKRSIALALCCLLVCSPASAKTKPFVGVLWPMFGPFLAVGLVELVAELKLRPDIEVRTYLHQNWPTLVEDLNNLPKGTRTLVVGYSLGANSTVFVANKVDYIDSIIALQPSMLSWNPDLKGKVGRIVEIYNPKPEETLGGMGSKKLVGDNIEYIVNSDTHMGTQFGSDFRDLVKSEIAETLGSGRSRRRASRAAAAARPCNTDRSIGACAAADRTTDRCSECREARRQRHCQKPAAVRQHGEHTNRASEEAGRPHAKDHRRPERRAAPLRLHRLARRTAEEA